MSRNVGIMHDFSGKEGKKGGEYQIINHNLCTLFMNIKFISREGSERDNS